MTLPSSRSPRRWLGAFAAAAVSAACGACVFVPLPAETTVVRTGSAVASERPLVVTVLVNPDDDRTTRSLGRQMVDCITRRLSETTPVVRVAQPKEFYHSLFQLEPEEVLLNAATVPTLLSRPDIRQRADDAGLTHLILVSGATVQQGDPQVGGIPPVFLLGWMDASRNTRLIASIIPLSDTDQISSVDVAAAGRVKAFMVFPILVAWGHKTESSSCKVLGDEVVRTLRGRSQP